MIAKMSRDAVFTQLPNIDKYQDYKKPFVLNDQPVSWNSARVSKLLRCLECLSVVV